MGSRLNAGVGSTWWWCTSKEESVVVAHARIGPSQGHGMLMCRASGRRKKSPRASLDRILPCSAQAKLYPRLLAAMKPGATLGLSHGFLLGVMKNDGVDFRRDINVVLVAPKVCVCLWKGGGRQELMLWQGGVTGLGGVAGPLGRAWRGGMVWTQGGMGAGQRVDCNGQRIVEIRADRGQDKRKTQVVT